MSLPIIETIQTNIENLKNTKLDIKNAVNTDYDFIANEQIESYPSLIKQGIAHYKNRVPHATKEGTDLSFDSVPLKFENMTIKGDTSQDSTTGKNLFDNSVERKNAYPGGDIGGQIAYVNSNATYSYVKCAYLEAGKTYTISWQQNIAPASENGRISRIIDENNINLALFISWLSNSNSISYTPNVSGYLVLATDINSTNIMIEEGSTATDYEPYTGGVPSPNPDYPQDIHVVTGENTIHVLKPGGVVLPSNYTQLEYIRSTGTQWIDTEYKPNSNTKIEMLAQYFKLGADSNWYNKSFDIAGTPFSFGNTGGNITLTGNKELITMENGKIKSSTAQRTFNPQDFQCEYNLVLFAINRNGQIIEKSYNCKIYSCKLWENNTLVRDFIPCKNPNNEIGLYDMVSKTFFANQGTGNFVAGNEIHHADYPLSLGNMEFGKIGESQDKFFKNEPNNQYYDSSLIENAWYKNEIIKKFLFKNAPNESWTVWKVDLHEYQIQTDIQDSRPNGTWISALCDKFKNVSVSGVQMKDNEFSAFSSRIVGDINYIYFRFKKDSIDNLNDFKAFVENNNLLVYTILDKPVPVQITDETLISQLDAIDKAKGFNGTTAITSIGADLAPVLNFTAYLKEAE